jgi:hypothetical protein
VAVVGSSGALFALMERLFRHAIDCTIVRCSYSRLRELKLDVSTESFSAIRAFTYADLHHVVQEMIAWLTPAAVLSGYRALICGIFTINYIFESLSTVKIHALILSPAAFSENI